MIKPVLVFGYGNPSRGDDALGPELLEYLQNPAKIGGDVEFLTDFQLQIEHALDLQQRRLVLFADTSVSCAAPYTLSEIKPARDSGYTTHAMSPSAVLQVYVSIQHTAPPPCFLLSIKGECFDLGAALSVAAQTNLLAAQSFSEYLLQRAKADIWREFTGNARTIAA